VVIIALTVLCVASVAAEVLANNSGKGGGSVVSAGSPSAGSRGRALPAPSAALSAAAATGAAAQSGTIPVGPGPQSPYTVAAQPPAGSCHYRFVGTHPLPDRACTPGATNPKVTQATLSGTICRSGYTSDIRPPVNITSREKRANAESYHYTGSLVSAEYDHLISLELGGDPNDPRNLWVEPNDNKSATSTHNDKDTVENRLHSAICANKVTLRAAQQAIVTDWTTALAVLKLG